MLGAKSRRSEVLFRHPDLSSAMKSAINTSRLDILLWNDYFPTSSPALIPSVTSHPSWSPPFPPLEPLDTQRSVMAVKMSSTCHQLSNTLSFAYIWEPRVIRIQNHQNQVCLPYSDLLVTSPPPSSPPHPGCSLAKKYVQTERKTPLLRSVIDKYSRLYLSGWRT